MFVLPRLARAIMTFFDRGVHCASTLSSLAMNREMALIDVTRGRGMPADNDDIASDHGFDFSGAAGEWKDSTTN